MKVKSDNLWTSLESKQISKEQLATYLFSKLGRPSNPTQANLYQEILKKINSYYFLEEPTNYTTYSLTGTIKQVSDIIEKKFKEGKRKGQTYYVLKVSAPEGEEKLQAKQEDLSADKWKVIQKSALLSKNLVFKYKKYITNKQIIDFYPAKKSKLTKRSDKA